MSGLIFKFAILATLANTIQMQTPTLLDQQQQLLLPNQNQNQNQLPGMQQYQNGQIPQMQVRPGQNSLLGGLLGGNNSYNNGSGLMSSIRNIPQRGMEIMNSFLSQVRNILPGLGRSGKSREANAV